MSLFVPLKSSVSSFGALTLFMAQPATSISKNDNIATTAETLPNKQTPPSDAAQNYTVVLDPGHGEWVGDVADYDSGAVHRTKRKGKGKPAHVILEKDLNFLLTAAVAETLHRKGVNVVMTHNQANFMGKGNRHETLISLGKTAIDYAHAFISIHHNKFNGQEIIYNNASGASLKFAQSFGASIRVAPRPDVRDLAVLKYDTHVRCNGDQQPAILFEAGDIDSSHDRDRVLDPQQRAVYAQHIADAIIKALETSQPKRSAQFSYVSNQVQPVTTARINQPCLVI